MIRRELAAFFAALGFFTRLPVPGWAAYSADAMRAAPRYLPAIGLLIGALSAGVYLLAQALWPQAIAVLLAMAAGLLATGAFHEDGLADTADGLGGGWDKARILDIMKDSRVGSYGVIALWLGLSARAALLMHLAPALVAPALLAGHALSRWFALWPMLVMDYARDDSAAKSTHVAHRLPTPAFAFAALCAAPPLYLLPPLQALAGLTLAALSAIWLIRKYHRWLGGYTGDALGAIQQVAEIAFYLGVLLKLG